MGRFAARNTDQEAAFRRIRKHFDVNTYQTSGNFTTWQLYNELLLRVVAADAVLGPKVIAPTEHVERILTQPLTYAAESPPRPPLGASTQKTVMDTTVRRLIHTAALLSRIDSLRIAYESWIDGKGSKSDELLDLSVSEVFLDHELVPGADTALGSPYADSPCVTINIDAPDKVIEADFKQWLKQTRSSRASAGLDAPERSQFTPTTVHGWIKNHRVLAYLDLQYLLDHFGLTITREEMGSLLFPDYIGEDLQSKVGDVARLLPKVLSANTLSALALQAQSDYAEWVKMRGL